MVVALLALSVAMGGTAYAALVITGNNVKDGSLRSADIADGLYGVQGRDVKNGSLGAIDLSAAARVALKGNAGATGPVGPTGAPGVTYDPNAVVPSGTTLSGYESLDTYRPSLNSPWSASYPFPLRLPTTPAVGTGTAGLNGLPSTAIQTKVKDSNENPACAGNYANPTAPSGTLCLYLIGAPIGVKDNSFEVVAETVGQLGRSYFIRGFSPDTGAGDAIRVSFTWAYTAP